MRPAHARLGDLDDALRDMRSQLREHAPVDLQGGQVPGVNAEHGRPGRHGALQLRQRVYLYQRD